MADTQTYTFKVAMSCGGCSSAVNNALKKVEGISKVDISLEKQTVVVETTQPKDKIFETIQKTGKAVTAL